MVVKFICPDCRTSLNQGAAMSCVKCRRDFSASVGVHNLLPQNMEQVKANEDSLHTEETVQGVWRRLVFNKRISIEQFERDYIHQFNLKDGGTFLELGGGVCYASALVKSKYPFVTTIATDVSLPYLQKQARKVAEIICAPVDMFAAVDGENLPFADNQFSAVFCHVVLYRLPDPVKMLNEIKRVLAPGGVFLGVERAFPDLPFFYERANAYLQRRSQTYGVTEKGRRWNDWESMLRDAGIPSKSIMALPGTYVKNAALRRLKAYFSPVPIQIRYVKE